MVVELPAALLRKLHPRRSLPGSAKGPTKRAVKSLVGCLSKKRPRQHLEILRAGIGQGPNPELGDLQGRALELLADLSAASLAAATPEELVAANLMVSRASEDARTTLVPGVVVTRGLEDALDLVLGSFGLTLGAGRGGWMTAVYLQEPDGERRYTVGDADLRHASCAASDEDYERARDHADRLRRSLPTFEQVLVAELFPDEPWADELLAELLDTEDGEDTRITALASAARDPVLLTRLCRAFPSAIPQYALDMACVTEGDTLLSLFAEALPPLLEKPRYGPLLKTPPRLVATAIGLMNTRAAAEALAPYLGDRVLAPVVTDFFREHPEHAAVLATHATGRGKATAERLAEQRRGPETEGRVADPKEVPAVLRDRPWRPGTMKGPAPRVAKATLPEGYEERVELPEQLPEGHVEQYRAMTKEELAKWRASVETGDAVDFSYSHTPRAEIRYLQVPPEEGLAAWSTGRCWTAEPVLLWVAAHGLAALDGFIQPSRLGWLDYELADQHFAALCCFVSPRMAPMMARIAVARKKWRAKALRWLERHVETVALGLVVAAAGAEREPRSDAEQALLHLAGRGHAEVLRAAAKRCGDEVMAILDELLARDPLAIDAKPPKRPAFLHLDGLPAVTLTNGARLDDDARDALTEMLAVAPRGYPGLARVAEACDAESLAGFAGGLLEQWLLGDAPGRHDWMLHAVVHVPSEANERRVAELARDWARNKKAKAFRACEALGMLGTDRALMHLGHIAATSRFADLRAYASEALAEAAEDRGLTPEALADRTVPDVGLDAGGSLTLSFGPRAFVATLSPMLEVQLADGEGKVVRALPRPRAEDDAAAAKASRERLAALKKDVAAIAQRQIRRFEEAMVDGRWLSGEDFRRFVLDHPVLMHLARGLVWEIDAGTFRVAEDGSFADARDEALTLWEEQPVRVAHPLRQPLSGWASLFDDYEILQPFEQIHRLTASPSNEERKEGVVRRAEGVSLGASKLIGLFEARGWRRDAGGAVSAFLRPWPGGVEAILPISPGFEIAYLKGASPQRLEPASFVRGTKRIALDDVDPVAFSELVRDLTAAVASAK